MKLDKILGARRREISCPDPARHARKCSICRHKDRRQIDADFLDWRSTREIVRQYALPHRVCLYRHAAATGLTRARRSNLGSVLDAMIEQVASVPITGSTILRAIRAYSCLGKHGAWIEPPTRVIVNRYRHSPSPASSAERRNPNRYSGSKKCPNPMKTNFKPNS